MESPDINSLIRLGESLFAQQKMEEFCDLILETDSFSLAVHGCVLASRSKLLASAMLPETTSFDDSTKEKCDAPARRFRLEGDVARSTLQMLLELVYTGRLTRFFFDGDDDDGDHPDDVGRKGTQERKTAIARSVADLAERLDMPDVIELCEKMIRKKARGRPKGGCAAPKRLPSPMY